MYGTNIPDNPIVLKAQAEFEFNISCEKCYARFAVIGAAYFCPCCGFNSVERTAIESLNRTKSQIEKLITLTQFYEQEFGKDESVFFAKYLTEKSLISCISTLQSFCESKYNGLSSTPARFNIFQNIIDGNKLWKDLTGTGYVNWLTNNE